MEMETRPKRRPAEDGVRIYIDVFCPEYVAQMDKVCVDEEDRKRRSLMLDRRTFVVSGDTTEEAVLEAISALSWMAKWVEKVRQSPDVHHQIAPEESDFFPGRWQDMMGITAIPKAKRHS
jgi:hypothetical protein